MRVIVGDALQGVEGRIKALIRLVFFDDSHIGPYLVMATSIQEGSVMIKIVAQTIPESEPRAIVVKKVRVAGRYTTAGKVPGETGGP